jgi:hypothetical protein
MAVQILQQYHLKIKELDPSGESKTLTDALFQKTPEEKAQEKEKLEKLRAQNQAAANDPKNQVPSFDQF